MWLERIEEERIFESIILLSKKYNWKGFGHVMAMCRKYFSSKAPGTLHSYQEGVECLLVCIGKFRARVIFFCGLFWLNIFLPSSSCSFLCYFVHTLNILMYYAYAVL